MNNLAVSVPISPSYTLTTEFSDNRHFVIDFNAKNNNTFETGNCLKVYVHNLDIELIDNFTVYEKSFSNMKGLSTQKPTHIFYNYDVHIVTGKNNVSCLAIENIEEVKNEISFFYIGLFKNKKFIQFGCIPFLTLDIIKSTISMTFSNYQEYITENELIELLEKFVNFYKSFRLLHIIR